MQKTPDFLKNNAKEIDESGLATLSLMIDTYDILKEKIAKEEAYLDTIKKSFNKLTLETIPDFLLSHGITKMSLEDGREVKIKEDISATVKDELAFRKWLKDRHEDAIIKTAYKFGTLDNEKLRSLSDFLMDKDYDYEIDESIHSQTKKKYFRELLKEMNQTDLPEWVTIYNIRKATIK